MAASTSSPRTTRPNAAYAPSRCGWAEWVMKLVPSAELYPGEKTLADDATTKAPGQGCHGLSSRCSTMVSALMVDVLLPLLRRLIHGDFSFSDIFCRFCYRIALGDEIAFQMDGINTNVRISNFEPRKSESSFPKAIDSSVTWRGEILAKPAAWCAPISEHIKASSWKTCAKIGDR